VDDFVVSSSKDGSVRLWDTRSGSELQRFQNHQQSVTCVAISFDGRLIVSGGFDGTVRVLDIETGDELKHWRVRQGLSLVRAVAFSPDARRVLAASFDQKLRLWDVDTGEELSQFNAKTPWITSVAFLPDGQVLSGGGDKIIRVWKLPR